MITATASESGKLIEIEEDGRTRLFVSRDEAFALLEAIEAALAGMPVDLSAEPKTTSDKVEQR